MLDLDALLAPISDHQPAGEDLSFSIEFDRIQEARRSDDPTLDQGEWQTDIKYADWSSVARQCGDLLQTRTKDLRLAGWMTEATTQIDGFAGLALGYRLIAGLCDRYWDEVHPLVVDGDHEERIGNLSWLLTNSLHWLRAVPIARDRRAVSVSTLSRPRIPAAPMPDPATTKASPAWTCSRPYGAIRLTISTGSWSMRYSIAPKRCSRYRRRWTIA